MKEGWTISTIINSCTIEYGTRVVRKRDGGSIYSVYGGGGATFYMNTYNRQDCLVIARFAMSQKCTRFVQGKFFLNDSGLTLRSNNTTLLQRFLDWQIIYNNDLIYSLGKGSAQKNLDMNDFKNIKLKYPKSLSEQQRIVEILDAEFAKIDALKANAEKSLQAAKDLFQSALKQALEPKKNWECKTVAEISENLDYKRIPVTKKDREDGIYPYYGASGIVDYVKEYLFDEDLLLVSEDGANLIARSTPIAFSVSGKIWVNNHAHVLRFPTMDLQRFVEYFFANYDLSDYITGAAQPKLTQKALNSIIIEYPSDKEELAAIISRLDNLDERCKALQENYRKTIALCEDLKQALLRKAFNGEL